MYLKKEKNNNSSCGVYLSRYYKLSLLVTQHYTYYHIMKQEPALVLVHLTLCNRTNEWFGSYE